MPSTKNSPALKTPRVPPEVGGIQINFCKNPGCLNFGIPASATRPSRSSSSRGQSGHYRIVASLPGTPLMRCTSCGETFPVKSNLAIAEELARLSAFLAPTMCCCPDEQCANHTVSIDTPKHYRSFGTTAAGSARYQCKACGRLFSVAKKAGLRQRQPAKNRMIFSLLMNKSPMRRICEVWRVVNALVLGVFLEVFVRESLIHLTQQTYRDMREIEEPPVEMQLAARGSPVKNIRECAENGAIRCLKRLKVPPKSGSLYWQR